MGSGRKETCQYLSEFNSGLRVIFDIWERRELLKQMTSAEISLQYKNKTLGFFWAILDPIFLMITYWVLVSVIFDRGGPDYAALLFVCVLSWRWFLQSALGSIKLFVSNASLVQTVKFPLAILVLSRNALHALNFLMGLVAFIPLSLLLKLDLTVNVFWILVLVPIQFFFNLGVSLLFALIGIYLRDLHNLMSFALRLIFYLSPGLYSLSTIPAQYQVLMLSINPFASLFEAYKGALVTGVSPSIFILVPLVWSVALISIANKFLVNPNRIIKDL